jgi:thiol-disulfide isomerase/thioredoxin
MNYIELPSDWLRGGCTHHAIARQTTYAEDSKIQFSLPDLHGNIISLHDQRFENKAILVNIYGSWCGGCQQEIPYLIDFKNKYQKEGLEIVGIAFERGSTKERLQAIKDPI